MGIDAEMYVSLMRPVDDLEILDLAKCLYHRFGNHMFLCDTDYGNGEDRKHCAYRVDEVIQDGPTIHAEPGETFIELRLWGRYYGEGYERGPWHAHDAIIRYIKHRWPEARVFYGGDSSGVLFEECTDAWLARAWAHFCAVGHEPYQQPFATQVPAGTEAEKGKKFESQVSTMFGAGRSDDGIAQPDPCPRCMEPLVRCGWGKTFASYYCLTCDQGVETHDSGETWQKKERN